MYRVEVNDLAALVSIFGSISHGYESVSFISCPLQLGKPLTTFQNKIVSNFGN